MQKSLYILVITIFITSSIFSQNLIPNGGFENGTCPTFASQLNNAVSWNNPSGGTPELFHSCANQSTYVKPPNILINSYQYPRTGQGFIGLFTYRNTLTNFREYAQVKIIKPMVSGKCYYFEMFVNNSNFSGYVSDGMGAYFSTSAINSTSPLVFAFSPHISNPPGNLISDTLNWVKISGYYTATGGEQYLTIGNFKTDANTTSLLVNSSAIYTNNSYLLVDDVSLYELNPKLDLGNDTILCDGGNLFLDASMGATSYRWQDGILDSTRIVNKSGNYSVSCSFGGCVYSDTIKINFLKKPKLNWPNNTILCSDFINLNAWHEASTYLWQDNSTLSNYKVQTDGLYYCTVTNMCGSDTDSTFVKREKCFCNLYIPNSFTPNGDNTNDNFSIKYNCELSEYDFKIFNRWGEQIFMSKNPKENWNGKRQQGEVLQDGVYPYVLEYKFKFSERKIKYGTITIIR